ncbi:hypothetical protein H6F76_25100 [Leptolyngbya sp. FACHB-321]|uniref:hypothetical protein n=1 Tax=Leptolyngbya sp. FACHB-321 TaxID=2692807 RepID=UPI00168862CB|nr:hypothetical protein [Leptolyngbya sp. FACHB-321]MBD2038234.1 hypothetical protein [Leptolyngbya sp. FACHB-321]
MMVAVAVVAVISFGLLSSFSGQVHATSADEPACYMKTPSGQTVNLNKLCGKGDASSTQEIAPSQPLPPDPYRGLPDPSPYPVEEEPVFVNAD